MLPASTMAQPSSVLVAADAAAKAGRSRLPVWFPVCRCRRRAERDHGRRSDPASLLGAEEADAGSRWTSSNRTKPLRPRAPSVAMLELDMDKTNPERRCHCAWPSGFTVPALHCHQGPCTSAAYWRQHALVTMCIGGGQVYRDHTSNARKLRYQPARPVGKPVGPFARDTLIIGDDHVRETDISLCAAVRCCMACREEMSLRSPRQISLGFRRMSLWQLNWGGASGLHLVAHGTIDTIVPTWREREDCRVCACPAACSPKPTLFDAADAISGTHIDARGDPAHSDETVSRWLSRSPSFTRRLMGAIASRTITMQKDMVTFLYR